MSSIETKAVLLVSVVFGCAGSHDDHPTDAKPATVDIPRADANAHRGRVSESAAMTEAISLVPTAHRSIPLVVTAKLASAAPTPADEAVLAIISSTYLNAIRDCFEKGLLDGKGRMFTSELSIVLTADDAGHISATQGVSAAGPVGSQTQLERSHLFGAALRYLASSAATRPTGDQADRSSSVTLAAINQ